MVDKGVDVSNISERERWGMFVDINVVGWWFFRRKRVVGVQRGP